MKYGKFIEFDSDILNVNVIIMKFKPARSLNGRARIPGHMCFTPGYSVVDAK